MAVAVLGVGILRLVLVVGTQRVVLGGNVVGEVGRDHLLELPGGRRVDKGAVVKLAVMAMGMQQSGVGVGGCHMMGGVCAPGEALLGRWLRMGVAGRHDIECMGRRHLR